MKPILIALPSRYMQGAGVLRELPSLLEERGLRRPMLLWGKRTRSAVGELVLPPLKQAGIQPSEYLLTGQCSREECRRVTEAMRDIGADVIVALGGGKALDLSKGVAHQAGVPGIVVPTILSNDAPPTACTVWYHEDGSFSDTEGWPTNPDIVLVDTEVCIKAPLRMFLAGIADSLATYLEAEPSYLAHIPTRLKYLPTITARMMAKLCWEVIRSDAEAAVLAVKNGVVTPAYERVAEASILLSGVGWESCGTAAAHVLGTRLADFPQLHETMHGEKVSFGIVTQLLLDPNTDMGRAEELVDFMLRLGLPVTMEEIGLDKVPEAELMAWCRKQCVPGSRLDAIAPNITAEELLRAIHAASAFGHQRKELAGKDQS